MKQVTLRRRAHRWRRAATLLGLVAGPLAVGCRRAPPAPLPAPIVQLIAAPPAPISPWPGTLATALRAAESGRFAESERILTDFGLANPATPEGAESDFWRALLKTDPANRAVTPRESMALYDSYLSGGTSQPRYAEALILRRVVESMDSTRALLATVRASADAREKSRDEEIRRLNDVVDRTTAELERIKRRLIPKP
ncbi:MAG: hypothetical protein ABI910_00320 [Gemmatimonadota bacterium]